jgi:PAS domain S-box-containing protein
MLDEELASLKAALELDPAGVSIFARGGRLDYANPAFRAIYGISAAENIAGRAPEDLEILATQCISKAGARGCFALSFAGEQTLTPEYVVTKLADGRTVKICHHPRGQGGWITRHVLEDDFSSGPGVAAERISLQALIDRIPDYLWIKDASSRFVIANLALATDSGREKSSDMIGLTDFDLHEPDKAAHFKDKESEILRSGIPMLDEEEAIIDAAGREKWLSSSKIPLRNGKGEIVGLIGVARDITSRKKTDELRQRAHELEENSRQLEKALENERRVNALQRQFVSMASHEFRTPLAIIDGAAQRLVRRKEALSPDFVEEKSQQIRQAVGRMVDLMESILSFGRLESGSIQIKREEFSLRDLLSFCCDRQQELSKDHHISAELTALPDKILADRSALELVFTNLLSNAVKYSPGSPHIRIRGWGDGGTVHISVRDSGVGIDQDDLPKMFERYFRARTSTGIPGTGIGLNLVKQIVELHGGQIALESRKGEGSIFTVSLPVGSEGKRC